MSGRSFGRYRLVRLLARGGMAEVYLGVLKGAAGFEKRLVIKKILPIYTDLEEFTQLFTDEARISVSLNHSHIVQVFDFGVHSGEHFIAMEYVDGPDLEKLLIACRKLKRPMAIDAILYVATRIAAALEYAHTRVDDRGDPLKIVHRDVSPPNVLLSIQGEVKITDFGVAKYQQRLSKSRPGVVRGKYAYMSPEQLTGQPLDSRSDLFSLGTVLYEMLTTKNPFLGATDYQTMEAVVSANPGTPLDLRPDAPRDLVRIIQLCLAGSRDSRYQRAGDVRRDLAELMFNRGVIDDPALILDELWTTFPRQLSRRGAGAPARRPQTPAATDSGAVALGMPRMRAGTGVTPNSDAWGGRRAGTAQLGPESVADESNHEDDLTVPMLGNADAIPTQPIDGGSQTLDSPGRPQQQPQSSVSDPFGAIAPRRKFGSARPRIEVTESAPQGIGTTDPSLPPVSGPEPEAEEESAPPPATLGPLDVELPAAKEPEAPAEEPEDPPTEEPEAPAEEPEDPPAEEPEDPPAEEPEAPPVEEPEAPVEPEDPPAEPEAPPAEPEAPPAEPEAPPAEPEAPPAEPEAPPVEPEAPGYEESITDPKIAAALLPSPKPHAPSTPAAVVEDEGSPWGVIAAALFIFALIFVFWSSLVPEPTTTVPPENAPQDELHPGYEVHPADEAQPAPTPPPTPDAAPDLDEAAAPDGRTSRGFDPATEHEAGPATEEAEPTAEAEPGGSEAAPESEPATAPPAEVEPETAAETAEPETASAASESPASETTPTGGPEPETTAPETEPTTAEPTAAEPTTETASAADGLVELVVDSRPLGASLTIDGVDVGKGPYTTRKKPGSIVEVAASLDGYMKTTRMVRTLTDDSRTVIELSPTATPTAIATGVLEISSTPWAYVAIDGRVLGKITPVSLDLPAGQHVVTLENPESGWTARRTVEVEAGETVTLEFKK